MTALVIGGAVIFASRSQKVNPTGSTASGESEDGNRPGSRPTTGGSRASGPRVVINQPNNGAEVDPAQAVTVAVSVEPDTNTRAFILLVDGQQVDSQAASPLTWSGPGSGSHQLQVRVELEAGGPAESSTVSVRVRDKVAPPPARSDTTAVGPAGQPAGFRAALREGVVIRESASQFAADVCKDCLHENDQVTVRCWQRGTTVIDGMTQKASEYWARIEWGSQVGYVSDMYLFTPKEASGGPRYEQCPP